MCPQPTLVDLYSGCGGASSGFKRAGFKVVAAVEIDHFACQSYEKNIGIKPIEGDIRFVTGSQILEKAGLERGKVDVVVGCPPCQGFSSLRRTKKGDSPDFRDDLLMVFANLCIEIFPRIVVFENVPGILRGRGKDFVREFISELKANGYFPIGQLLNSADYGVPQRRKRFILILAREEAVTDYLLPALPKETHAHPNFAEKKGLPRWVTVEDKIADLPRLDNCENNSLVPLHEAPIHSETTRKIIQHIPKNGGSRKSLPKEFWLPCHKKLNNGGAENVYGRMSWSSVSPTITSRCVVPACGRFVHPEQNRAITLREAARLQSFDDDFVFVGTKGSIAKQIGNAMPPALAAAIGEAIHPKARQPR